MSCSCGGPYKAKRMRLSVKVNGNTYILGVVEATDIELIKEGGVAFHYDGETGCHSVGTRHATFRLRRWFKTDCDQTDLLFDLMHNEIHFNLEGEISDLAGSMIGLSNCLCYNYKPVTGGANDIVSEEVSGEALDWYGNVT